MEETFEQDRKSLVDSISDSFPVSAAIWEELNETKPYDFTMTPEQKELYSNSIYKADVRRGSGRDTGEFDPVTNLPNGRITRVGDDGVIFDSFYVQGKWEGLNRKIFANGTYLEGMMVNSKR